MLERIASKTYIERKENHEREKQLIEEDMKIGRLRVI